MTDLRTVKSKVDARTRVGALTGEARDLLKFLADGLDVIGTTKHDNVTVTRGRHVVVVAQVPAGRVTLRSLVRSGWVREVQQFGVLRQWCSTSRLAPRSDLMTIYLTDTAEALHQLVRTAAFAESMQYQPGPHNPGLSPSHFAPDVLATLVEHGWARETTYSTWPSVQITWAGHVEARRLRRETDRTAEAHLDTWVFRDSDGFVWWPSEDCDSADALNAAYAAGAGRWI